MELRVVASRFLPEVVTLSIWGIMRLPARGQDLPCESVSRSISRVHQRPLSRSVRSTQWTCLFWSSCAALFRTMRPRESSVYIPNQPFFDLTFRRITTTGHSNRLLRSIFLTLGVISNYIFNDLTKKDISDEIFYFRKFYALTNIRTLFIKT